MTAFTAAAIVLVLVCMGLSVVLDCFSHGRPWRFQFRLRTLMIGVTLFCVTFGGYIGWQMRIVRERLALLERVKSIDKERVWMSEGSTPWLRQHLGDQSIAVFFLPIETSVVLRRQIHDVFPESQIVGVRVTPNPFAPGMFDSKMVAFPDDPDGYGREPLAAKP